MPSWISLVFYVLRLVPAELSVVQEGMATHWGKDHVAQAQKALALLGEAAAAAGAGMAAGTVDPSPSPEMGSAPPPHA